MHVCISKVGDSCVVMHMSMYIYMYVCSGMGSNVYVVICKEFVHMDVQPVCVCCFECKDVVQVHEHTRCLNITRTHKHAFECSNLLFHH
jgi:hypothetical protein